MKIRCTLARVLTFDGIWMPLDAVGEVTVGLSDLLLCLEMAIVSVVHTWIFSPKEHQHGFFELIDEDDVSWVAVGLGSG